MPLRVRQRGELIARLAALGCLGVLALSPAGRAGPRVRHTDDAGLDHAIRMASREHVERLQLNLAAPPDPLRRSWLAAIRGAGTAVSWRLADSAAASPVAIVAERLPSPPAASRVLLQVLADPGAGADVMIADDFAILDSTSAPATGVTTWIGPAPADGRFSAQTSGSRATARVDTAADRRPVLVIARAGWEGRFVVAALEEAGWPVESEFLIAPASPAIPPPDAVPPAGQTPAGGPVFVRTSGAAAPLDTARFSTVVALDPAAARRAVNIVEFVRSGGGLVLGVDALIPAFQSLAPAVPGVRRPAAIGQLGSDGDSARAGLALRALRLSQGSLPLELAGGLVAIAARREHLGRVVAAGYEETWRWRLLGNDQSPSRHREWWSALVAAAAARRPAPQAPVSADIDQLPLSATIEELGPPSTPAAAPPAMPWSIILFVTALLMLPSEWTSRRLRGER